MRGGSYKTSDYNDSELMAWWTVNYGQRKTIPMKAIPVAETRYLCGVLIVSVVYETVRFYRVTCCDRTVYRDGKKGQSGERVC